MFGFVEGKGKGVGIESTKSNFLYALLSVL